jgi:hypothetical protein
MKTSKNAVALFVFTIIENVAICVSLLAWIWISSFPFTVTQSEVRTIHVLDDVAFRGLAFAWISGPLSVLLMWPMKRKGALTANKRRWVIASICVTLIATLMLLWPKAGAVAGTHPYGSSGSLPSPASH